MKGEKCHNWYKEIGKKSMGPLEGEAISVVLEETQ